MASCIKCGDFTINNGGLCSKCYKKSDHSDDDFNLEMKNANHVFPKYSNIDISDKELSYRYNPQLKDELQKL